MGPDESQKEARLARGVASSLLSQSVDKGIDDGKIK